MHLHAHISTRANTPHTNTENYKMQNCQLFLFNSNEMLSMYTHTHCIYTRTSKCIRARTQTCARARTHTHTCQKKKKMVQENRRMHILVLNF
jgi:hypothetical protein